MGLPTLLDIDKICRICMCNDQEMCMIFEEKQAEDQINLAAMLMECTKYKVERFDELPHLICRTCLEAARNAFRFKRTSEQTYRTLIGLLSDKSAGVIQEDTLHHGEKSTQTEDSTLYPCERCDQKYITFDALRTHRANDHKGSAIVCRFCLKTFNRIGYLKTHIAVFHPESGFTSHNQCHICERQFMRREHMRRHLAVIHKIVDITDESVQSSEEAERIADSASNSEMVASNTIELCNVNAAMQSVETENKEIFPFNENKQQRPIASISDCEAGDEYFHMSTEAVAATNNNPLSNFTNATAVKNFMEVQFNEKKQCNDMEYIKDPGNIECLSTLKTPQDTSCTINQDGRRLRWRNIRKNSQSLQPHEQECKCEACNEVFRNSPLLKQHIKKKHGESKFSCKICSKCFLRTNQVKRHMKLVHQAASIIKCEKCDSICTDVSQYRRHKKMKHSERSHKCETCQKCYTTRIYLQRHMSTHDKKRFICKECSQGYMTKEDLNAHIKAAGHDKPLLCPECGLRCKTSNILMVHMRRHNGEKPFKCKFCSKGFPRMDDLRVHEKYENISLLIIKL